MELRRARLKWFDRFYTNRRIPQRTSILEANEECIIIAIMYNIKLHEYANRWINSWMHNTYRIPSIIVKSNIYHRENKIGISFYKKI